MQDPLEKGQPLDRIKALDQQGVGTGAQGLQGAAGPAAALAGKGGGGEGRQAGTELLRHKQQAPAGGCEPNAGGQIL